VHAWRNPSDPEPSPSDAPDERDERDPTDPTDPSRDRPPTARDPEALRAPGAGQDDPTTPGQPPMHAGAAEHVLDSPGIAREAVGNDNIREGRVGGVMGPPHASNGQGQGG
jgi:hypothetical protein